MHNTSSAPTYYTYMHVMSSQDIALDPLTIGTQFFSKQVHTMDIVIVGTNGASAKSPEVQSEVNSAYGELE